MRGRWELSDAQWKLIEPILRARVSRRPVTSVITPRIPKCGCCSVEAKEPNISSEFAELGTNGWGERATAVWLSNGTAMPIKITQRLIFLPHSCQNRAASTVEERIRALRNYPHALTSILRGLSTTIRPGMCSGTPTRLCVRILPQHLSCNFPHALLLISAATPTIRTAFPPRRSPKLCSDPQCRSNPIAHRVRRKTPAASS
jgi:hypothetical protein